MIRLTDTVNLETIYRFQMRFGSPWFFPVDFDAWRTSFEADVDGEGRTLFKDFSVKAAYDEDTLVGFIQYGRTAFGFEDGPGSYCVIRNLYFDEGREDAGSLLLKAALDAFAGAERVYAFFHYFGMSCFARHGKLFEGHTHIAALLREHGFETEHENVYYSSVLTGTEETEVEIVPQNMTKGRQQYMDFMLAGCQTGGCEVHFVDDGTAYLRWIYVNENTTGRGIGTRCMTALKHWLYRKGVVRFDTDTALDNTIAQHFYEKNGFTREGITRSYLR